MKHGDLPNRNAHFGFVKRFALLVAMISLLVTAGFSQNYPFPQNYQYPYGQIYKGSDVQSKIQGLYNTWLTKYYVEGTMGGTPVARIKFQQPSGTDQDGHASVSEGIVYGMLIMVYMDNATNKTKAKFDRLWEYYKKNVDSDGVMNWKVNAFTGQVEGGTYNAHGATDAELDAAQALLMAYKQWGDAKYLTDAKNLINIIWTKETFVYNGKRYLKPGNMFQDYLNPCYFITNAMQLFADPTVNPTNDWSTLVQNSYDISKVTRHATTGLVPDWCYPNGTHLNGIINDKFESYFLYDAIRMPWRMAHAYAWYGHADAKDIAKKMTDWAITKFSGNPANAKDGYFLDGSAFTSNHPNFSQLGKFSNPCFTGGFGVGAMVDNTTAYKNFLDAAWQETSKSDPYGAYYTHTTQLLYLLVMTGNMPNFYDMKPVALAAETNANGNIIYVDFSKNMSSSTTTAAGWLVQTYESTSDATATSVPVQSVAIDATNPKRVAVTLSSEIAEPYIKISYSGTLLGATDGSKADPFGPLDVLNKITNMEPYALTRITNVTGTQILIQWSKDIAPASINKSHFTLKVNNVTTTINTASLDPTDPTVVVLEIDGGKITSKNDVITLSFAGGSITGTSSPKTAKAFTNAPVQNFYLSVTCDMMADFESGDKLAFTTWTPNSVTITADPTNASNKVLYYKASALEAYAGIKQGTGGLDALTATQLTNFMRNNDKISLKYYYKPGNATTHSIRVTIAEKEEWWTGGAMIQFTITPKSLNAWHEHEHTIKGLVSGSATYKWFIIELTPGVGNSNELYVDDIQFCPPSPTVSFQNARTSYEGNQIEVRFNTAMKVPTDMSAFTVNSGVSTIPVTSIASKQGDASILVLTLATPIADETAEIYISGGGSSLKSQDNRDADYFMYEQVLNLYGVSVTTGWRDDFNDVTDYITANIGGSTKYTFKENTDGTFTATIGGGTGWEHSMNIVTFGVGANASKQVMDLTGREIVEFKYRVPSSTSPTLILRIDVKDKINNMVSDAMAFITLPKTTTWTTQTIDISTIFQSLYGSPSGIVDRSNIYEVQFKFMEKQGTEANNYIPTVFNGKIDFDYISIGSALTLTIPTTTLNQGQNISATSSATGKIYVVPGGTPPTIKALQDSVFAGKGVVVDCVAGTAVSIPTTALGAGYFEAYAYDPIAGAISGKIMINIIDITPPIITQFDSGNFAVNGVITATVNEDAILYLIPASVTDYSLVNIDANSKYSIAVSKDVSTAIMLENVVGIAVGNSYKFIAVDYAYPTHNISAPTTPAITIINAPLSMTVTPTGVVGQGDPITVSVNRPATAYLIPNTQLITSQADLTTHQKSYIAISGSSGILPTTGVPQGEYYVYVSDGTTIVGPSAKITLIITNVPVESITATSPVSVAKGGTTTVQVSIIPSDASSKAIDLSFTASLINAVYDPLTQIVTITGVNVTTVPTQLILTSNPDNKSTTINVSVTCPTLAPTALEVPNVTTCSAAPDPLVANLTGTAQAVWYSASTGGTALYTGNVYAHGKTSGLTTYYVAKNDNGCESATRRAVDLNIIANPIPVITQVGPFCKNDAAVTLTATPTGGTWSGAVTTSSFNPATAIVGNNLVTYTVVVSGCTGSASSTIVVNAVPTITATGMPTELCQNAAPVTLATYVSPNTGTFTLASQVITQFNPSTQTTGNKTVTYSLTENGCTASQNFTINVKAVPTATIIGLPQSLCVGAAPLNLTTYVSVQGGTFTDNLANVSGTTFTPSTIGTSNITHTLTVNGCTGTGTGTIIVNPLPVITPIAPLCTNDAPVSLSATPTGGTWSGTGVSSGQFNPTVAGVGEHTITYTSGCVTTTTVTVNSAPAPIVANLSVEKDGTPAAFSATGVAGTVKWYKDVQLTNLVHTGTTYTSTESTATEGVVYTYYVTNSENGCTSTATMVTLSVTSCSVAAPTNVSAPVVCQGASIPALTATATGTLKWYSATDVELYEGASFDPTAHASASGITTFKVSQTVGCEGTKATTTVTINSKPNAPTVTNAEICVGETAKSITAVGTGIIWKNSLGVQVGTGASYTPSETAAGTYTYSAISVSAQSCESNPTEATYKVIAKPAIPTIAPVSACQGSTIPALAAQGSNIKWYATAVATTPISTGASYATTETTPNVYTYYASQTIGACESDKASGTVTINEKPSVSITAPAAICLNAAPVSVTVTPIGGTLTGSGVTGTTFDPAVAGLGAKTLTYSYTDLNLCSNTATHSITVNSAALPTAADASIQINETIPALVASGGTSYTWYNEANAVVASTASYTPVVSNATPAVFTYFVTNTANGCESAKVTVKLTITDCSTLAPTVTNASVCAGGTIPSVSATGTSIKWYNEAGTQVGTGATYTPTGISAPGDYSYYATQTNVCEGPKSKATITIKPVPSVSISALPNVCSDGSPVTLSTYAEPTGGVWSGNGVTAGVFTPSSSLAGNVELTYTYTDANSCSKVSTASIVVTHVAAPVIANSPVIVNVNVTPEPFTATGTSLNWYSDASLLSNVGNGTSYSADAKSVEGDYKFYVTQTVNSCVSVAAVATLSVTSCSTPIPSAIVNGVSCVNQPIPTLSATGTSLTWYSATNEVLASNQASYTPVVSNAIDGNYSFYVSQTNGCEGPKAPVTLQVNPLPVVTFASVAPLCTTDAAISLNSSVSPAGGTFSGAVSSAMFNPATLGEGSHTVVYTYNNGTCTNTASRAIVVNNCGAPLVTSIVINGTASITTEETAQLSVQVLPAGASTIVQYTVADPTVLTVSASGLITPLKAGSTTITATAQDGSNVVSNTCNVTISSVIVPVSSVTFNNPSALELTEGQMLNIAQYVVVNPSTATSPVISYQSLDPSYASVSTSGVVTAASSIPFNKTIQVTVTVMGADGISKSANLSIAIKKASILLQTITIPSTLSIEEGKTASLSVTSSTPSNADDKTVTWSIVSGTGATINASTGLITVTGTAGQSITVVATANDAGAVVSNQCVVSIVPQIVPITGLNLDVSAINITKNGTAIVTVSFNPQTTTQTELNVSFGTSGVVSVVKLSATQYEIIGLKGGTQSIQFQSTSNTALAKVVAVTVTEPVEQIIVSSATGSNVLTVNQTLQMQASVLQTSASNKNITWSSSDETVATVSTNGLVTAVKEGLVYISAKAVDGSDVEGSLMVSVNKIPVTSIVANNIAELEMNKTATVSFTVNPTNATYKGVTFTSSNQSIATVDEFGVITPVSVGVAVITITSQDDMTVSKEITVNVVPVKADVTLLQKLIEDETWGAYSVYYKVNPLSGNPNDAEIFIGFKPGEVLPLTYNKFLKAWSDAQDVYYAALDGNATQDEVDAAAKQLYDAIVSMGVTIPDDEISIDTVKAVDALVYPTRFKTFINIKSAEIESVKVLSIQGRVIEIINANGADVLRIETSNYAQGTYVLHITTKYGVVVKTVFK